MANRQEIHLLQELEDQRDEARHGKSLPHALPCHREHQHQENKEKRHEDHLQQHIQNADEDEGTDLIVLNEQQTNDVLGELYVDEKMMK